MKKLMIALAGLAAATVLAEGIESNNTVGYQLQDYRQQFQLGMPTFNTIGGTGVDIQSLIPTGENATGGGSVNIQTLNQLNQTVKSFYWLTDDDWGTDCGKDGWFESKDDTEALASYTFAPGEGFMLFSGDGEMQLTVSGEVKYPTSIPCVQQFQIKGNYLPLPVSIQDIIPTGENATGGGSVNIQTLNQLNQTVKSFYWLTDDDWGTDCGEDGWFESKDDTEALASYTFAAGEGFLLFSGDGAMQLQFPEVQ